MNKLPEQYTIDLFNLIVDAQSLAAQINEFPYSDENAYSTGVEIAAIGVAFATKNDDGSTANDESLVQDILSRAAEWSQKLKAAEAAHAAGACGCGADHESEEEAAEDDVIITH